MSKLEEKEWTIKQLPQNQHKVTTGRSSSITDDDRFMRRIESEADGKDETQEFEGGTELDKIKALKNILGALLYREVDFYLEDIRQLELTSYCR